MTSWVSVLPQQNHREIGEDPRRLVYSDTMTCKLNDPVKFGVLHTFLSMFVSCIRSPVSVCRVHPVHPIRAQNRHTHTHAQRHTSGKSGNG